VGKGFATPRSLVYLIMRTLGCRRELRIGFTTFTLYLVPSFIAVLLGRAHIWHDHFHSPAAFQRILPEVNMVALSQIITQARPFAVFDDQDNDLTGLPMLDSPADFKLHPLRFDSLRRCSDDEPSGICHEP
jgi:hypothetical protein